MTLPDGTREELHEYAVGAETHRAVLHRPPPGGGSRVGIVMLPSGLTRRIGPGGLYVPLARQLARHGYLVLRVDFPGIGDASGELDASTKWAAFRMLESGHHVEDALACVEWFRRQTGVEHTVVLGLCGGAVVAAIAGATSEHVAGIMLLNGQLTMTEVGEGGERVGAVPGEAYVTALKSKLARPRSWLRLLTLQSDWRKIARALGDAVASRLRPRTALHPLLNVRYLEGLALSSARRRRILMVFGEWDDNLSKYQTEYVRNVLPIRKYACKHDLFVVEQADHNFTSPESREKLFQIMLDWLSAGFERQRA